MDAKRRLEVLKELNEDGRFRLTRLFYPRYWDKARLKALVRVGYLSEMGYHILTSEDYADT